MHHSSTPIPRKTDSLYMTMLPRSKKRTFQLLFFRGIFASLSFLFSQYHFFPPFFLTSSILLEGELTSVKISQDSRFALVNHAPDVRKCLRCSYYRFFHSNMYMMTGSSVVGPGIGKDGPKVHWATPRPPRNSELLWWDRWEFCRQW